MNKKILLPVGAAALAAASVALIPSSKTHPKALRSLTPGSINVNVTQDNIQSTICVSGWTATIRPPVSYTNKIKKESIRQYGFKDLNLRDYELDHLISLELGGNPTDPKNLWAEPEPAPNVKDKEENLLHKEVCSGQISLTEAQQQIVKDWTK